MLLIGLMSGTSADGVDAVLAEIAGHGLETSVRLVAHRAEPFSAALREAILSSCEPGVSRLETLCALGTALGDAYARAAAGVAADAGIPLERVEALACHGQTIWHQPTPVEIGGERWTGTMQIGSAAALAARTGVPVVSDFRSADMAAGGQGAPLVPYADMVLFASRHETRAVQNIGGIANVTHLPARCGPEDILAFDTGPGNMVIDEVVRVVSHGRMQYDRDGHLAARGKACSTIVEQILRDEPFFSAAPPKSTGRELFGRRFVHDRFLPLCHAVGLSDVDTVATATLLTARSIARGYEQWLEPRGWPDVVILGGGGVHNPALVGMLRKLLAPASITSHAAFGIPGNAKEALAFAILAYETIHGRPSNIPAATGAARAVVLGSVTPSPDGRWPVAGRNEDKEGDRRG